MKLYVVRSTLNAVEYRSVTHAPPRQISSGSATLHHHSRNLPFAISQIARVDQNLGSPRSPEHQHAPGLRKSHRCGSALLTSASFVAHLARSALATSDRHATLSAVVSTTAGCLSWRAYFQAFGGFVKVHPASISTCNMSRVVQGVRHVRQCQHELATVANAFILWNGS